MQHPKYPHMFPISHLESPPDSGTAASEYRSWNGFLSRWLIRNQHSLMTSCEDDILFPRSAILTVILSLHSNTPELEVSSPKLLLGFELMDMIEVDNGTSDVAAAEVDGAIDVDKGPVFELNTVAP